MDIRREGDARGQGVGALAARILVLSLALAGALANDAAAFARVEGGLQKWASTAAPSDTRLVWVMLQYRGDAPPAVSARAMARRVRRAPASLNDPTDRPLAASDLAALAATGFVPRQQSRWLRAVSGIATPAVMARLNALPQVVHVVPVRSWRRAVEITGAALPDEQLSPLPRPRPAVELTQSQNASLEIDKLQQQGYHGEGMVVGMLDTGATTHHPALEHTAVLASYDFIHHDAIIDNESGQDLPGQRYHGTETWSVIGGYEAGVYVGGAYAAQFALAKTENIATETRVEEDNWIAGLEWADSLGADVVSSSLGYNTFDDGSGYTKAQLDGNTALCTIAADMAVARGLVVVTAMGNSGATAWQKMLTPADADSAFSIGAIDSLGVRASFSSLGPTADGRIKPDFVARGINVIVTNPIDTLTYGGIGGTSLATPLVAALCTLLLQAHPDWSPMTLREALRSSADRASAPDTLYGWGQPSGLAALAFTSSTGIIPPGGSGTPPRFGVQALPSPARSSLSWWITAEDSSGTAMTATLRVCTVSGRCVRTLPFTLPAGTRRTARQGARHALVRWDLRDAVGRRVAAGRYIAEAEIGGTRVTGACIVE